MVYIHLHEWLIFMVDVGKYTVHGCYGIGFPSHSCSTQKAFGFLADFMATALFQGPCVPAAIFSLIEAVG